MPSRDFPRLVTRVAEITPGPAATAGTELDSTEALPTFTVLRTTQVDGYEDEVSPAVDEEVLSGPLLQARRGDDFAGTSRKAAKTSISGEDVEEFDDLRDLIQSLASAQTMKALNISEKSSSNRVEQEERNVRVQAFMYAASRESDNDFHVIIGRYPDEEEMYMNVEVSGLPPPSHPGHARLKAVRDTFKRVLSRHPAGLPGTRYDFYRPALPVTVTGSLFWDVSHEEGAKPGPQDLRDQIPTIWEIHPISHLEFGRGSGYGWIN